jgi:hypothetical protein
MKKRSDEFVPDSNFTQVSGNLRKIQEIPLEFKDFLRSFIVVYLTTEFENVIQGGRSL